LSYLQARRVRSQNFKALLLSKDMTPEERENEWLRHFAKERMILRKRRQRLTLVDFHLIIKVGEGAYGEVCLFICLN
jgi:cell cycle protein kinase DBF2